MSISGAAKQDCCASTYSTPVSSVSTGSSCSSEDAVDDDDDRWDVADDSRLTARARLAITV